MTEEGSLGGAAAASAMSSSSSGNARQQRRRRRRRSSRQPRRLIDEADYEEEEEEEESAMDVAGSVVVGQEEEEDDDDMGNTCSSTKPSPPPCRWAPSSASASASAASSTAAHALLSRAPHDAHEPALSSERRALGLTGLLAHAACGDAARFVAAAKRVGDDAKAWGRTDVHGRGVLHLAAVGGHAAVLREALASKMLPVDQEAQVAGGGGGKGKGKGGGATALTYALARRDMEAAVLLLAEGAFVWLCVVWCTFGGVWLDAWLGGDGVD